MQKVSERSFMIIKQTDVELTVENGKPIKFVYLGTERSVEEAIELYGLDESHSMPGAIYGKPLLYLISKSLNSS